MSAERYTLHADNTDWLDVRDPHGNRNTVNQPAAVALIRQQSADIAELRAECESLRADAELWRATQQPVAWMYDRDCGNGFMEEGLVTPFNPLGPTQVHGMNGCQNIRPLYLVPQAPQLRQPTLAEENK